MVHGAGKNDSSYGLNAAYSFEGYVSENFTITVSFFLQMHSSIHDSEPNKSFPLIMEV